jgi:hypothetical protein
MKKTVCFLLFSALLLAPLSAAPTEDEVGEALGGVMMIYSLVLMGALFGAPPEGAQAEIDPETGSTSLMCKNLDVTAIISTPVGMGMPSVDSGDEEFPELRFSHMSGEITTDEMGNLFIDVQLVGGPVKSLTFRIEDDRVTLFKAGGKDFRYLADAPLFWSMMEE